jgi:hypothetical protein
LRIDVDVLEAELARKRKEIASTTTPPNKNTSVRKTSLAEREKSYLEEEGQARLKAERDAKAAAKLEEARLRDRKHLAKEECLRKEIRLRLLMRMQGAERRGSWE